MTRHAGDYLENQFTSFHGLKKTSVGLYRAYTSVDLLHFKIQQDIL
jgi:hypothetical protein